MKRVFILLLIALLAMTGMTSAQTTEVCDASLKSFLKAPENAALCSLCKDVVRLAYRFSNNQHTRTMWSALFPEQACSLEAERRGDCVAFSKSLIAGHSSFFQSDAAVIKARNATQLNQVLDEKSVTMCLSMSCCMALETAPVVAPIAKVSFLQESDVPVVVNTTTPIISNVTAPVNTTVVANTTLPVVNATAPVVNVTAPAVNVTQPLLNATQVNLGANITASIAEAQLKAKAIAQAKLDVAKAKVVKVEAEAKALSDAALAAERKTLATLKDAEAKAKSNIEDLVAKKSSTLNIVQTKKAIKSERSFIEVEKIRMNMRAEELEESRKKFVEERNQVEAIRQKLQLLFLQNAQAKKSVLVKESTLKSQELDQKKKRLMLKRLQERLTAQENAQVVLQKQLVQNQKSVKDNEKRLKSEEAKLKKAWDAAKLKDKAAAKALMKAETAQKAAEESKRLAEQARAFFDTKVNKLESLYVTEKKKKSN